MKNILGIIGLLGIAAFGWSYLRTAAPSDVEIAYQECTRIIRETLPAKTTKEEIEFAPLRDVDQTSGDEFYFAFSGGKITGATRDEPDLITGSMDPSAACIGSLSNKMIAFVTVNGKDAVEDVKFQGAN